MYDGVDESGVRGPAKWIETYAFNARCDGGAHNVGIRVHPDFSEAEAANLARKFGRAIGQLPKVLRHGKHPAKGIKWLNIIKSRKPFYMGGLAARWSGRITMTSEGGARAFRSGHEALLVHEAAHVSLGDRVATDSKWRAAQQADGRFITGYASKNVQEDVAESFLAYLSARGRPSRIGEAWKNAIFAKIPNRIAYFDALLSADDMNPFSSASLPRTAPEVPEVAEKNNPVSLSVSANGAIAEGDAALTITATLETANATGVALAIPVRVRADGTTATAGDYTLAETISIPDGASSGTTAFAVVDDSDDEPGETVVVELGSPLPAGIAAGATDHVTITIADNDNPVSLSVSANGAIAEGDAALTITATLETANATGAALAIPVRVRKAGTTATAGDDYTLADTISIPDGASSGTTAFAVVDDSEDEPRETVVVELGSPLPAGIAAGATDHVTIAIADNDNPVSLSVSGNGAIAEGDAALTITATLETANATGAALAIPVRVRKAGTTATAGDDYTLAETISIADGASSGTTAFAVVDDDEGEPRETVVVELGSPLPAGIAVGATALVTIAIADNDARTVELTEPEVALTPAVTVALAAERASVAEDNGEVKFTVTLSRALEAGETAVVPLTVTGGKPNRHWNIRFRPKDNEPGVKRTAAGRDSAVTFTEGGRVATLVLIARPNHDTVERTIRIAFGTGERAPVATGVAGGIAPAGGALSVAIVDDDAAAGPAFWVKDERAREDAGAMRFAVRLTMPAAEVVQVRARTRDARPVSARANRDYEPVRVDLSFRPGETKKHVRVRIFNDAHDEGRETFELVLSNAEGAVVADRVAVGTIENDDPLPTAQQQQQVADPEVTIAAGAGITEGGSATFVLTADPVPAAPLGVTVTVATEGAFGITAGERTVTIPTTGSTTLTLATDDDDSDEPNGSVTATVAAGTGYTVGTPSSGSVAIADDDVPEIEITAGADVTEGTAASFVLTATPPPATALGVTVTVATEGAFGITAGERTVTIPTSGTYTLTLATDDDGTDEPNGSVTATVDAGTGYTVGTPSSGSVAIADDDVPEIEIAAGADVTEGTAASFVLTATPSPATALEVTVTIAARGDYGITAGERTVTIPTSGTYTLTLATDDDGTDEPNGSVTATVDAGTGYTVGTASTGTVAIADDDLPPPAVSVAAKAASIIEGGDAVFTVTADRAVDANLAVTLAVSEAAGSDFVAAANEGAKTVTIPAGKTSAALTVKTVDDKVDEPNGSVTAALAAGAGYTVAASPQDAASVAVADNDAAGVLPVLSVESRSVQEGNRSVILWATIDPFPSKAAFPELHRTTRLKLRTIEGTAWDGVDYVGIPAYFGITEACNFHTTLAPNGKHGCRIDEVTILDDSHDDGGETFQLEVGFADSEPAPLRGLGAARGTITIENSDPLPAAYLARFGRTVVEQALDGIAGRMSASRTPGMRGTVAGQSLSFDPAASGQPAAGAMPGTPGTVPAADREAALAMAGIARGLGADASAPGSAPVGPGSGAAPFGAGLGDSRLGTPSLQSRSMTARDALLGSSFSLTGQKDGAGGSLAFWGRASQASFDGAERGDGTDIRLDGTVTTGMLGADYARGKWMVGLALTQSSSEGSYAAIGGDPCPGTDGDLCDGAVRAGDGDVEASLTAAIPYAVLQVSERLKLWGAAGYGTGEVTLKTMEESYKADTSWTMAAAGVRGDLLEAPEEGSGPALALTSDALWARTSSDKTRDLAATDSDATRLRLGLEGSYRVALDDGGSPGSGSGASLTPKLEIGARHDGGDAETGFGVEIGGGIAWVDPGLGLSLDVSGRTLLAHENDDLKDRGMSASLAFDPAPATQRGPSFSLRQDFGGQASGGLDALFNPAPLEDRTGSEATSRWSMEAAYGVPAFGGRFTGSPHVGLGLATGARDYSLGWRLTPEAATAPDLSFGLKATRRESDTAAPEHTVGVEATMRW